jgi:hypothetical protein
MCLTAQLWGARIASRMTVTVVGMPFELFPSALVSFPGIVLFPGGLSFSWWVADLTLDS